MKDNWILPDAASEESLRLYESCGIDRISGSILYSRGLRNRDEVMEFIYPELNNLHSPYLMRGIPEAVNRIREAIAGNEKIAIFADSDLDGITSLTIIHDLLTKCGVTPLIRYPKNKEGYGLTCDIITEFISGGVQLLITVDSGIRDLEEISYASANGIDTIITDHHEPDKVYPKAIIVNPKMPECNYPFKDLAGVGVAFKLAQAVIFSFTSSYNKRFILINADNNSIIFHYIINGITVLTESANKTLLNDYIENKLTPADHYICTDSSIKIITAALDETKLRLKGNTLAGLACMLTGISFKDQQEMLEVLLDRFNIQSLQLTQDEILIKVFLELQMRSSKKFIDTMMGYITLATVGTIADIMPLHGENRSIIKYGLEVFKNGKGHCGIQGLIRNSAQPTAKDITWDIAPLLNAPGRLGETGLTVDFFLNKDISKILEITREIEKINRERKKLVSTITEQIRQSIEAGENPDNMKLFFYMSNEIISGLAGLIASRVADDLKKPVIIAVIEPDSDTVKGSGRSYNDFNFFRFVEPFSDMFERIGGHAQAFGFTAKKENILNIIKVINDSIDVDVFQNNSIMIDALIDVSDISASVIDKISLLEPFGKSNEEPLFAANFLKIDSFLRFGKNGMHGKYILKNGLHVIGWNMSETMEHYFNENAPVDMIFNLENNIFMNRKYPRLRLIDIVLS